MNPVLYKQSIRSGVQFNQDNVQIIEMNKCLTINLKLRTVIRADYHILHELRKMAQALTKSIMFGVNCYTIGAMNNIRIQQKYNHLFTAKTIYSTFLAAVYYVRCRICFSFTVLLSLLTYFARYIQYLYGVEKKYRFEMFIPHSKVVRFL